MAPTRSIPPRPRRRPTGAGSDAPPTRPSQLVLVSESTNPWHLSRRARTVGRQGVARARDALADARRPLRRAG
ncbi:MAG: hypothetical protein R3A49_08910 [Acidimicrobiia bacterium]